MIQKIAIVYHALRCGGAEKELLSYISMLDKNRYEVHILLTQKIGELLNNIPKHAHIHEVGGNSVKPNLTYLVSLYANLKKIEPSITLGFMQDICLSIGILHLLRLISGKFIISEQVVLSEWQKVKKTFFIKRVLISFLYKHADTILAQTQSIKDDLINNFSIHQNRIVVMPSYIENTLKQVNNHVTYKKIFYPKKLRKRLFKKATENGWKIVRQDGSIKRKWEQD